MKLLLLLLWPLLLTDVIIWWHISIGASAVWASLLVVSTQLQES